MGMDTMYLSKEIEKEKCKQATDTLNEIEKLIEKYNNKETRESLKKEINKLKTENLKLRQELSEYKTIIEKIQIIKGDNDEWGTIWIDTM